MTTEAADELLQRITQFGEALTFEQGRSPLGFFDLTGSFPRANYLNSTSLNQATYGAQVHSLSYPSSTSESIYPLNQVKETYSGHVIEYNDTPGGERILIKHRSGSGVEMKPDGSIVISTTKNRVEVIAGDNSITVEGDANLTYNGNLNLNVTGDFNVSCLNYNVTAKGNKTENIQGYHDKKVAGSVVETYAGNRAIITAGSVSETRLGNYNSNTKGYHKSVAQGDYDILSGGTMTQTAVTAYNNSSTSTNIAAQSMTIAGNTGTIGGENIVMYNYNMYTGHSITSGDTISTNTAIVQERVTSKEFVGSLTGNADTATEAGRAGTAGGLGAGGSAGTKVTGSPTAVDTLATVLPTESLMTNYLEKSSKSIRNVIIDAGDYLLNALTTPPLSVEETRARMRDPANRSNAGFVAQQCGAGSLNTNYASPLPSGLGRFRPADRGFIRGRTPLGNSSSFDIASPFRQPNSQQTHLVDPQYNVNNATSISSSTRLGPYVTLSRYLTGNPLPAGMSLATRKNLARNFYYHSLFLDSVRPSTGLNQFSRHFLRVVEGYYRPAAGETLTPDSVLSLRTEGRAVVYKMVDQNSNIDLNMTYDLAVYWKNTLNFEKLILDYDNYDPRGIAPITAHIIIIIPNIPESYSVRFNNVVETQYNNEVVGTGLVEVTDL